MEIQALMMLDFSSVVDVVIYTSVEIRGKQTTIVLQKVFVVAFSTLAWSMVSRSNLVLRFVRLSFEGRSLFFGPYGPFVVHPRVA